MKNSLNLLFILGVFAFTACNDDDNGGNTPPPTPSGQITADISSETSPAAPWSLPVVTARMSFFNITITARDNATGEVLVLNLPNNGEGIYFGESFDFTNGAATYFANTNATPYHSARFQDDSFIFVDLTSIDSVAQIINGTFSFWAHTSDTVGAPFVVMQNGNLIDVPYTGSSSDVNTGEGSTFTATVDGTPFTPDFTPIFNQIEAINIQGTTFTGEAMFITIPYTLTSGTYELGFAADPENPIVAGYGAGLEPALATEGTLTFTRDFVTQNINGTFSFEASSLTGGDFSITNGVINANY